MGKLISKNYYLDYNSTSPLAKSVRSWLSKGDFDFMNPSSVHAEGKRAREQVRESLDSIHKLFGTTDQYSLFFHSGATEGNNTAIRGWADSLDKPGVFFCGALDHPSICNLTNYLEQTGHQVVQIPIDEQGNIQLDEFIEQIKKSSSVLINYTVINNETGVHWSFVDAQRIKEATGALIHVDASQLVGKISNWQQLCHSVDIYTFSGHKFGALKGTGFSLYKKGLDLKPLLVGGGQQDGFRSGTLNVTGIKAIDLALREMAKIKLSDEARNYLEQGIEELLRGHGELLFHKANFRSLNTIFFVLYDFRPEVVLASFDLEGLQVSAGSACSAEIIDKKSVLKFLKYDATRVLAPIRISLGPHFSLLDAQICLKRVKKIFMKLFK